MTGKRKMLVTNLLSGAGGWSRVCQRALTEPDLEKELVCVNHPPPAVGWRRSCFDPRAPRWR